MEASKLYKDAMVVDSHNDRILRFGHSDQQLERQHFAEYWLPEMRANGVNVSFVAICPEDPVQSEIGLRDTLLLVERIYDLAAEQADDVAVCLTGADIDAAKKAGKIALVIALEGVHEIGQNPRLIRTMAACRHARSVHGILGPNLPGGRQATGRYAERQSFDGAGR